MKRLNWSGFAFTMAIVMLGAIANKNVSNILEWLVLIGIGLLFALFPLIAGRKPIEMKRNGYKTDWCLKEKCGNCGLKRTPEGYDGCIGHLKGGVMNACCGHGNELGAYIQFDHENYKADPNKLRVEGKEALKYIEENSIKPTDYDTERTK